MKVLDIALKDMLRSFRSAIALVFMFILPLLTTGLLYFAFGGLGGDDGDFDLPVTRVQVVNLDQPIRQISNFSAGQFLVDFLQDEQFAELLDVTVADDEVGSEGRELAAGAGGQAANHVPAGAIERARVDYVM